MQVLEQWVMLLDERGLRATGMELLIRVENGKAPPLSELCSSPEISLSEVERTISQDPSQCGEREVNTRHLRVSLSGIGRRDRPRDLGLAEVTSPG